MLMMLPFEAPTIFEGIHKSYFRMPRVVKDQRSRFENDDLFRQLSHESEVKYTGFKDRPVEERQMKFIANCEEGHTEVSVVQSGNQFTLMFNPAANPDYNNEGCDFNKELGKVHIKSGFILNGVCVLWTGWIDLQRLEGFGRLEFDEYRAYLEEAMTKQQLDNKQCNNNSQISRLNQHMGSALPPQSSINQAAAAAAAVAAITTNTMLPPPPLGLNANCLGQSHPNSLSPGANNSQLISSLTAPPPPPPVSLADSAAAHYGNAAIAAAAAAAFHQALSVGGGGGLPPPSHQQSLHPLSGAGGGPASSALAAVAASNGLHCPPPPPHSLVPSHLTYTNGTHMIPSLPTAPNTQHQNTSPQLHTSPQHQHHHHHSLNGSQTNGISSAIQHHITSNQMRSPERENHHQHHQQHHHHHHSSNNNNSTNGNNNSNHFSKRQAMKRPQEEQTQIDEVDVVSDITAHDLDFPPKRIFKSDSMTSHHNHHHKISRRAA